MTRRFTHQRFEGKLGTDPATGCTVWLGARKSDGTGLFVVNTWNPRRCTSPQRYAYQFYVGPIPVDCYVKAKCGNPLCVTPRCLRVKTRSQAIHESIKAGRWTQLRNNNLPKVGTGYDNPNARYQDDVVERVRQERSRGDKLIVISHRHHIPVSSVGFICSIRKG